MCKEIYNIYKKYKSEYIKEYDSVCTEIKKIILTHIFLLHAYKYLQNKVIRNRELIQNLFNNEREYIQQLIINVIDKKKGLLIILKENLLSKYLKKEKKTELLNLLNQFKFEYTEKETKTVTDVENVLYLCIEILNLLRFGDLSIFDYKEEKKKAKT